MFSHQDKTEVTVEEEIHQDKTEVTVDEEMQQKAVEEKQPEEEKIEATEMQQKASDHNDVEDAKSPEETSDAKSDEQMQHNAAEEKAGEDAKSPQECLQDRIHQNRMEALARRYARQLFSPTEKLMSLDRYLKSQASSWHASGGLVRRRSQELSAASAALDRVRAELDRDFFNYLRSQRIDARALAHDSAVDPTCALLHEALLAKRDTHGTSLQQHLEMLESLEAEESARLYQKQVAEHAVQEALELQQRHVKLQKERSDLYELLRWQAKAREAKEGEKADQQMVPDGVGEESAPEKADSIVEEGEKAGQPMVPDGVGEESAPEKADSIVEAHDQLVAIREQIEIVQARLKEETDPVERKNLSATVASLLQDVANNEDEALAKAGGVTVPDGVGGKSAPEKENALVEESSASSTPARKNEQIASHTGEKKRTNRFLDGRFLDGFRKSLKFTQ